MNSARVSVPTPLRQYTDGQEVVLVEARTVSEALGSLTRRHPELKRHLLAEDGSLRAFVNIYLNDEDIRYLEGGYQTRVDAGDEIRIVPSIAGGSAASANDRMELSASEMRRYARHLILPEVGLEGQRALKRARVLLVGAGGLGSPASLYLAAAGVGTLGLVDFDRVDESNLHRQVVHGMSGLGRPKLESARERLLEINPDLNFEGHEVRLTAENAMGIVGDYEIVVDGTDNFPTRYLINDTCVLLGKPNVYGSIFRFEGQASIFDARHGPCYRCLYQEPPPPGLIPSCAEGGVLGVLPGIIGAIQANEAIKLILGVGDSLVGRLLLFDALRLRFRELRLRKDPQCPICGEAPTIRELIDYEAFCGVREAEPARAEREIPALTASDLKARFDAGDDIRVLDVRESHELAICKLDGAVLIPLTTLPSMLGNLSREHEYVVICRSGRRSAHAVRLLHEAGFNKVYNLTGGLLAWSDEVDPSMPKY